MLVTSILFILLGFVLLIKGADFLVDGASNIAKRFHIPEIIIGLTIVSIGTSMPELVVSTTSAINGQSDMAMGNVIGSNVCNLLLILGLSAMIKPVKFQRETRLIELPLSLIFTVIFIIFSNTGCVIDRFEAAILMVLFIGFIGYTIYMAKKGEEFDKEDNIEEVVEDKNEEKKFSMIKNILSVIIGIVALKIGGDLTVNNCVKIAESFNVSKQIISLTILAIGTSLPELVTSIMAAAKGNSDIAIGNVIGSNIFNMLLIIGTAAIISPIAFSVKYNLDLAILLIAMVVLALFPIIPPKNQMCRMNGLIYFLMYVGYIALMFVV